jgi:hypothetical protein
VDGARHPTTTLGEEGVTNNPSEAVAPTEEATMTNDDDTTNPTLDALIARIRSGQVTDGMSYRELKRKNWSKLKREKDIIEALRFLHSKECLWIEDKRAGDSKGRLSKIIRLHPDVKAEQQQWAENHK